MRADSSVVVFDGPYSWARLGLTMAAGSIISVGMWAIIIVLPAVQAEFGVDRSLASLPYVATMLGFALGNLLLGRAVDRHGAARAILVAAAALSGGFYLASLCGDIWSFTLLHGVVIGVATGVGFGPLIADVSHWFVRRRGVAMTMAASGNYLAGAIWPFLLKDVITGEGGWRAAYQIIALAALVALPPLALLLRRRPDLDGEAAVAAAKSAPTAAVDLSPRALQALLMTAGVACCVAMSMPQVHLVAYCFDLGHGVAAGSEMLSLMLVGGVVSRIASGFLADAIGGAKTLLLGAGLQALALALYLPFDGLTSLYVVSMIFGLSQGGIVPSYAIIVREYLPAREAGARVGAVMMATIVGMALGGWMSGWIYDLTGSYTAAFVNGLAWNLVNVVIVATLLWRTRPRRVQMA